jgi:predicted nucleic acid-binding protein
MRLSPVLVDTWALLALAIEEDQWHESAKSVSKRLQKQHCPLVTTEWILSEFLGSVRGRQAREFAIEIVRGLQRSSITEIVSATHEEWERGFELYRTRLDKNWSLVDCISIILCSRYGIQEVFTGDHHFQQAGLRILVPSRKSR